MKRKIFLKLGPKFTGLMISALLTVSLCFGIYHALLKPPTDTEKTPGQNATDSDNGTTENIDTESGTENEKKEEVTENVYSTDKAEAVTTPLSSQSALLCNNAENTVILQKNETKAISSNGILALSAALAVTDAIAKGDTAPTERAVCPASAIRLPCYSASASVLSVGQSLTVAELVKVMLCTEPELFAYTLAIHICGSEEAFVARINGILKGIGATSTIFISVSDASRQKTTALDAAVIFRAATENPTLMNLLSSRESFTVSAGGSAWDTVTLCGRFYSECCTEGQAKADGIICGYYAEHSGKQYVYMLFEQLGTRYMTVAAEGATAYADSLLLLSSIARK